VKTNELASIAVAIIALAALGVAVASGSQTASVLNAGASGFSNVIKAAAYGK
jgi:K+-transporting ATPase A subunit